MVRFEDYKEAVILSYENKKKDGMLPLNLEYCTPANLKRECIDIFTSRYSIKDEPTFAAFFGKRDNANSYLERLIYAGPDQFKPLNNFLRKNSKDTHDRNIELLAWLIGYEPRPYKMTKNSIINSKGSEENIKEKHDIFISYSWDNLVHEERVVDFTNHLRINGFPAEIDKMFGQEGTAINFIKMMYQAMANYSKVIVVLSEGYKEKADKFMGGVGTEYELLISDIANNPNKYILVSFKGRDIGIIPVGLKGRDIVDLSDSDGEIRLFEKLLDHKRYTFASVAAEKPKLPIRAIKEFSIPIGEEIITINEPIILPTGRSSSHAGKYKSIEFTLMLTVTNNTVNTVNGFACTLKIPAELATKNHHHADADGFVFHELINTDKLYPKQTWRSSTKFPINLSSQNINQVIGLSLYVSVFTEQGPFESKFLLNDLIKIKPVGGHDFEATLSPDFFL